MSGTIFPIMTPAITRTSCTIIASLVFLRQKITTIFVQTNLLFIIHLFGPVSKIMIAPVNVTGKAAIFGVLWG
jgi:hypothetical protein